MRKPLFLGMAAALLASAPALGLDAEKRAQAREAFGQGAAYLKAAQHEDGSWSPKVGPAVTGLAVRALLVSPEYDADTPFVRDAIDFLLERARPDGGIHEGFLKNYNTAISLSALAAVEDPPERVRKVLQRGRKAMRALQWTKGDEDPDGNAVDEDHPYYGGYGYGNSGRPDASNTQFAVQTLHDLGVQPDEAVFQRAVRFMNRLQGTESNDLFAGKIQNDGGAIYATSVDKKRIGVPVSYASPDQVERAEAGKSVSDLRTYGSMTYAMFKTYVYANLGNDDPRVNHALRWIRRNYTLEHNPGMPEEIRFQGYYYYLLTFSRALRAWGEPVIETADGEERRWAGDVIEKLAALQRDNGAWKNRRAARWMEDNPALVTSYALLAINAALGRS